MGVEEDNFIRVGTSIIEVNMKKKCFNCDIDVHKSQRRFFSLRCHFFFFLLGGGGGGGWGGHG